MRERFQNSSPGALTLEQARTQEIKRQRDRRRQAEELAAQGRGEDTEIAHVARGEIVVPEALQSPEVLAAVRRAAKAEGIPFEQLHVGSRRNSINPNTGMAEFDPQSPMPELGSLPNYGSHIPLSPEAQRELRD